MSAKGIIYSSMRLSVCVSVCVLATLREKTNDQIFIKFSIKMHL